ncbi:DUF423 domain-containing protein [Pseudoalteromonas tunicata]|uniref:DUF423 domain-containing protein n=1 Tax=Pseudoalteromonas tunicata D2 TaxID=87626 RepID=A4CFL7_9GAMM|nr:DUF423 domain-containing protein [Pseudoalteromonas tunicata]ATC94121.1 hypothetical protein PTUN_a1502 [Pseudoalteromonas tunicata]EAR26444.1 hypothetical protein PTD2_04636 [Pseudoalteromonas tunicata D2]MDP4985313.1 DUF423 domain-containing protein [Pseudoalteromonas tunicata]MDP5215382.1 DUF423 domain-containing protein [Pseudoalteromonas tunicata]
MIKWMLVLGAAFAGFAVILGAFAAHGLKATLSSASLQVFQTGVQYQMYHGLALILFALVAKQGVALVGPAALLVAGIVLFSGSLYLLSTLGWKWLGPITPLGGVCFIGAWVWFVVQVSRTEF